MTTGARRFVQAASVVALAAVAACGGKSPTQQSSVTPRLTTFYNTFGPNDSFMKLLAWGMGDSSGRFARSALAVPIVPTDDFRLKSITLALCGEDGEQVVVGVGDSYENASLESFFITSVPPYDDPSAVTLTSVTRPVLKAGRTYWISARSADWVTHGGWNNNDQGIRGTMYMYTERTGWQLYDYDVPTLLPAYRITGEPVSAP